MAERENRLDVAAEAAPCGRRFSEELLSGYLDGALTQGEDQRVRLHLEDCAACRALYAELRTMRETTMKTRFVLPADDQWDERPRSSLSRLFRGTGWTLTVGLAGRPGALHRLAARHRARRARSKSWPSSAGCRRWPCCSCRC